MRKIFQQALYPERPFLPPFLPAISGCLLRMIENDREWQISINPSMIIPWFQKHVDWCSAGWLILLNVSQSNSGNPYIHDWIYMIASVGHSAKSLGFGCQLNYSLEVEPSKLEVHNRRLKFDSSSRCQPLLHCVRSPLFLFILSYFLHTVMDDALKKVLVKVVVSSNMMLPIYRSNHLCAVIDKWMAQKRFSQMIPIAHF